MIPIYRAKVLKPRYIKEFGQYVEGDYLRSLKSICKEWDNKSAYIKIDPTTIAIHFPDTNIKDLFFGLENRKGASIIEALFTEDNTLFKGVAMHTHYGYVFYDKNDDWVHITKLKDIKAIGIQQ